LDADGTGVSGQESANPPTFHPAERNTFIGTPLQWRSEIMSDTGVAGPMIILMRATLHDHAPNTYYGHWLAKNAGKHAARMGAIAHNELVVSAGVATFDVAERDFSGNRLPGRWKFVCRAKGKSAHQAKWRASSDDHLLIASI
jgi:hypothetical protein